MDERSWNDLISTQHWVFSAAQWLETGRSRRSLCHAVRTGRIERVFPDVYKIPGSPKTYSQRLSSAVLYGGPGAAAWGHSAAILWDVAGYSEPGPIEIVTEHWKRSREEVRIHRMPDLFVGEVRTRAGISVVSPEWTVLGIAHRYGEAKARTALNDFLRRRLTTMDRCIEFIDEVRRSGRNGIAAYRRLVDNLGRDYKPFGSGFEMSVFTLLDEVKLTPPARQHPVAVDGLSFYIDMAYPRRMVGVEALEYEPHLNPHLWERDQWRHNRLSTVGWRIIYVTPNRRRTDPGGIVTEVRRTLELAGPLS